MTLTSQFSDMMPSSNFFNGILVLLSSLVTGPSFMSISSLVLELCQFSFIKDRPEIGKSEITPWVLPNIWRLGWVRDTKFSMNASNKMLLNDAKYQVYSFYHFWVIRGKPPLPPFPPPPPSTINTQIWLKNVAEGPKTPFLGIFS